MLLVIGDSHSVTWGGKPVLSDKDHRSLFPNISIHYLGAPLVYNLIADTDGSGAPGKWGLEVLSRVKDAAGVTAVCLCFGEIDVRTRAVKTALENGISLTESVERIADRLVAFCESLRGACTHPILPRLLVSLSGGLSLKRMAAMRECEVVPSPDRQQDLAVEFPDGFCCRFLQVAFESSTKVALDDIRLDVKSLLRQ